MNAELVEQLCAIRLVVGYLGERDQFGWWQSSFFAQGSDAFLSPLFSKTQLLAQCNGVTRAATKLHDERIGIGNVYHLFRLPEDLEQDIHLVLLDPAMEKIRKNIASRPAAMQFLASQSTNPEIKAGPILVAKIESLRNPMTWPKIAGLYHSAFEGNQMIFPYFAG